MNKELLRCLLEIGKQWCVGDRDYAFETRLCLPLSSFSYPQGGIVIIIDVQGFYKDEKWGEAIKLHHEEIYSTPELLKDYLSQKDIEKIALSFSQQMGIYKKRAYDRFKQILENEKNIGKVYTSDIFWMG